MMLPLLLVAGFALWLSLLARKTIALDREGADLLRRVEATPARYRELLGFPSLLDPGENVLRALHYAALYSALGDFERRGGDGVPIRLRLDYYSGRAFARELSKATACAKSLAEALRLAALSIGEASRKMAELGRALRSFPIDSL